MGAVSQDSPPTFVIVTAQNLASRLVTYPLLRDHADAILQVMEVPNLPVSGSKNRDRAKRLVGKTCLSFIAFKFCEIYFHAFLSRVRRLTIKDQCRQFGVAHRSYPFVSHESFVETLQNLRPTYLVSTGPAIIPKKILDIPEKGTLNCHQARLPEYQGVANYLWMLLDEVETAYSNVQFMDVAIDSGPVVAERSMPVPKGWSMYKFNYELCALGGELYADTVGGLRKGQTLEPLVRPDAIANNRGFPAAQDFAKLRSLGRRVFTLKDIFLV